VFDKTESDDVAAPERFTLVGDVPVKTTSSTTDAHTTSNAAADDDSDGDVELISVPAHATPSRKRALPTSVANAHDASDAVDVDAKRRKTNLVEID
jgi:hypothetical protein